MEIPLYSSDPTISFPRTLFRMSFDSSRYTSTSTEERVSQQEVDEVLKQFGDLAWKFNRMLILIPLLSLLIYGILSELILKICLNMFVFYIDEYKAYPMIFIFALWTEAIFAGTWYLVVRISGQKKAAFEDLIRRVNVDFVGRDLKWQAILMPFEEKLVLWKAYMELPVINFGTAEELDSSFYMASMTNGRIPYEQVDKVTKAIKMAIQAINEKFRRVCMCLALFGSVLVAFGITSRTPTSDDGRIWPGSDNCFIVIMALSISLAIIYIRFKRSCANKMIVATNNLLEQFNPEFMPSGFAWYVSSDHFRYIQFGLHQAREEQDESSQGLQI